jgi:hypothetical protein
MVPEAGPALSSVVVGFACFNAPMRKSTCDSSCLTRSLTFEGADWLSSFEFKRLGLFKSGNMQASPSPRREQLWQGCTRSHFNLFRQG